MNVLYNSDGWSSLNILLYALFIGYFTAPVICIVVFVLRKNKYWFNYSALGGEIVFFIRLLFHVQHYPWLWEISAAGSLLLLIAFIATLVAVNRNKIPASAKLGVILCLYALMFLNLSKEIFHRDSSSQVNSGEPKRELGPKDKRFIDSILKACPADTGHHK
jgi:hypothetical protein